MSEFKSMECCAWIKHASKSALTIKDIRSLKQGDTIKVLLLHRNVMDVVEQTNQNGVVTRPKRFFRKSCATYTHQKDMSGTIDFGFGKQEFEFDLRIPECWYPISS